MRHFLSILLSLILVLEFFPCYASAETLTKKQVDLPEYAEGEVLVTTSGTSTPLSDSDFLDEEDVEIEHSWDFDKICITEVSSTELSTEQLIDTISEEENVVAVEPNYIRKKLSTNDTYRPYQWYLNSNEKFKGSSPGIYENKIPETIDSTSPIVAVVDTGIDYTHEDLKDHMWVNPYSSLRGTYGYDFGDSDSDPMDDDEDGHGTHCAGLISALRDNSTGIAGISEAKLMALKIFNSNGEAKESYIISAFHYIYEALTLGANIVAINCSWGGGGSTSYSQRELIEQIGAMGSLFVFAAGNDGANRDVASNTCPYDINSNYIVKVGASDINDNPTYFSNYGQKNVDLFAPGDNILSTVNAETFLPFLYDEEQKNSLCSCYSSYDTYDLPLYTGTELGQRSTLNYGEKSFSSQDFLNSDKSGSLCIPISCLRTNATFDLFLDVTDLPVTTNKSYYVSCTVGLENNGSISWDPYSSLRTRTSFVTYRGRTYIKLIGISRDFRSTSRVYIDNPSISVATDSTTKYGKYNMLSGTSMSAPIVSGAVALLSSLYQKDTALMRKSRLLQCVRPCESLTSKCSTGGVLDLSKLKIVTADPSILNNTNNQNPTITLPLTTPATPKKIAVTKVKLNKKKAVLRYGKTLKLKATISPAGASNKKVKWTVSKKKYVSVTQRGVVKPKKRGIGHSVKVYAKATDGSGKKAVCTIKIKKKL